MIRALQQGDGMLIKRSFFFGPNELSYLQQLLVPHLTHCTSTTFELLSYLAVSYLCFKEPCQ
ncbi:LOW QUALITY PROTEIN: hypothetical protein V2J09_015977 [Rumex salicifolius]